MQPEEYWGCVEMPYVPFYAFEEIPSIFGDDPHERQSLTASIKELTSIITDGSIKRVPVLAKDEDRATQVRKQILGWYERHPSARKAYQEVREEARGERLKAEHALREASRQRRITTRAAVAVIAIVVLLSGGFFGWSLVSQRRETVHKRVVAIADSVVKTAATDPFTASLLLRELQGQSDVSGLLSTAQGLARQHLPSLAWKEQDPLTSIEFAPDDRHLVALTFSGTVKVLDGSNWSAVSEIQAPSSVARPYGASFRDADTLVTFNRDSTTLWGLKGNQEKRQAIPVPQSLDECPGPLAKALVKSKTTPAQLGIVYPSEVRFGEQFMLVRYASVAPNAPGSLGILPLPFPGTLQAVSGAVGVFNAMSGEWFDVYADTARKTSALGADGTFAVAFSTVPLAAPSPTLLPPLQPFSPFVGKSSASLYRAQVKPLQTIEGDVTSALLSADGQRIVATMASSLGFGTYATLDLTKSDLSWTPPPFENGLPIAVSRTGKYLALATGSTITVKSGDQEWSFDARGAVANPFGGSSLVVTFDRAEKRLVGASADGSVSVWNLEQLDHKPAADASWDALMTYFKDSTRACLDETQRHNLLAEDWLEAGSKAQDCRRTQALPGGGAK
jgi:WD40 repeat protein